MSNVAAVSNVSEIVETVTTVPAAQIVATPGELEMRVRAASLEAARDEKAEFDAYKNGRRATRNLLRGVVLDSIFGETVGDRAKMLARLETL